ncbi:hypothetical protein B9G55_08140 [Saccharibacillus sp. O16]|nr:hypothetical protein B9G55_08140 [Saccharibacillus sp. O16]
MDTEIGMTLTAWVLGGFVLLFVIGGILKGADFLLKRPYAAEERYNAVHAGGLNPISGRRRVHLLLNREALIIKPWFQPAIVIPFSDIEEAESSWVYASRRSTTGSAPAPSDEASPERLQDLEDIRSLTRAQSRPRQLMLHYERDGKRRIACFDFRYGEEEDTDREPFYRCLQSLDRRLQNFRLANRANASVNMDLRKNIEQNDDGIAKMEPLD